MYSLICPKCNSKHEYKNYIDIISYNSIYCDCCQRRINFWSKENEKIINKAISNYYESVGIDQYEEYNIDENIEYDDLNKYKNTKSII